MAQWRNWSGSVVAQPTAIVHPRGEDELRTAVIGAAKVRVVGAGHSFMPLCETDGMLVCLDQLEGEIEASGDNPVWEPAGWSVARLTQALWERGWSLLNQGDVNPQSLAGAISTGTHGTGAELGSLATFARAFRLMLADGSVVECSADERPELFQAQRLSLGLLGVATRIEIDVTAAYRLEEQVSVRRLDEIAEMWPELVAGHRHAEFFVFPYSDRAILKTLQPTQEPGEPKTESDTPEAIFKLACQVSAAAPALIPSVQRLLMRGAGGGRRVGPAHRIFPSERTVPFEEMEYELPRAEGLPALREVIGWIRKRRAPVSFPFEFRTVAADDIWLSPFNRGPGASVSMHQFTRMAWRDLFTEAEAIFRAHGGRPHWAKRHTLTWREVRQLYPMAERFREVCRQVDPTGKFANAHLAELFDLGDPAA